MEDFSSWSVGRLKAELCSRGLSTAAIEKNELVDRLMKSSAAPVPPRPPRGAADQEPCASKGSPKSSNNDPEVERVLACNPSDFYKILGVDRSEPKIDAALKKAYRRLALRLHPDKNRFSSPYFSEFERISFLFKFTLFSLFSRQFNNSANGADEAFKRISAAFATLRDFKSRKMYDFCGGGTGGGGSTAGNQRGSERGGHHSGGFRGGGASFRDKDAEDLYRAFFGGGGDDEEAGPAEGSSAIVARVHGVIALGKRLGKTFWRNPWALVTLLSVLASLVSVVESINEIIGKAWGS